MELKATELRIGNYLQDSSGNLMEVNTLSDKLMYEYACRFVYNPIKNKELGKDIKSIPLTKEWIEKLGGYIFKGWDDMEFFRFDKEFDIWMFELEILDDGFYYGDKKVEYVHDLQNCYFYNYNQKKELTIE